MVSRWMTTWLMRRSVCRRCIAMGGILAVAVTGNTQPFGADLRLLLRQQICQQTPRPAGHGPAQGAMPGIQEQVAVAGGPDDRRTVRRGRTQAGPQIKTAGISMARERTVDDHLQCLALARIDLHVETTDFRHAANSDAVVET